MEDPPAPKETVRRIVEAAQAERITPFGSAARGKVGPASKLDLLVGSHPRSEQPGVAAIPCP